MNRCFRYSVRPSAEPLLEHVLVCPRDVLERLRSDGVLRLRQQREELSRDRILRRHVAEQFAALQSTLEVNCDRLRKKIGVTETLLTTYGISGDVELGDGGSEGEEKDSEPAKRRRDASPTEGVRDHASGQARKSRIGIAPNDPPISFVDDFRGEFVDTLFNETQSWTFSFGSWYYRLKRFLFVQGRWKRLYRISQIENLSVSQELLMGVINALERVTVYPSHDCVVSDLEAAVCLLAAYHAAVRPADETPMTVVEILRSSSKMLKVLSDDLSNEFGSRVGTNLFSFNDPADMTFYAPVQGGRRYANKTFDRHVLVDVLFRRGVIQKLPGYSRCSERVVEERLSGSARDDLLSIWSRRVLGGRLLEVPVFVYEQHYLRSGLVALEALIFLWKVLNSESVFSPRNSRFSLRDVFPTETSVSVETGFSGHGAKNFEYVVEQYVIPWYERDQGVTVSRLWPGLVLLAVTESSRSGWDVSQRDVSAGERDGGVQVQSTKSHPVAEYMFSQASPASENGAERLRAHDAVLFHYENGLGRLLSVPLPKHRVLSLGAQLFNVADVYDCLYFFALGFLPVVSVT